MKPSRFFVLYITFVIYIRVIRCEEIAKDEQSPSWKDFFEESFESFVSNFKKLSIEKSYSFNDFSIKYVYYAKYILIIAELLKSLKKLIKQR